MGRVENKVALITGAARGQGRSHAVRLAEEGADIIALDICEDIDVIDYPMGTAEELEETARLVEKAGRRVFHRRVDVRDRAAVHAAIDDGVAELGRLDVVIPSAGVNQLGADRPLRTFTEIVDVNLSGVLNTVHGAIPHLGAGASIIIIGSAVGLMPGHGESGPMGLGGAAYSMAKQTLVLYTSLFSVQLAPLNIRINAVHPANVNTHMIQNRATYEIFRPDLDEPTAEDAREGFYAFQGMPIPYMEPQDVSHAIVYLASDESRYVTGLQFKIDAGALGKMGR
ncbi:3-ketoacyl-ACP reductase [Actinoplanes sp. SE50]|uniref:mycofactocin-coupled SDR family oxidoreductase n=1 Tax=unclassified Actinoplanes TaxID=2626549 RepID=UPI00023EBFAA|nr:MULTISPECIES: mycofactocin-coupled SDR family oxidoreductase [unclassified Actinoplanes]AEV86936.1 carveol dehydrogenase [Actinoplanes sp. SE50/110]ATO85332.1 3-ketoacyl-ACP reductase [Actinoplanes sp. SE50]SLM02743.1 3-ketoacyl-ACP reductase [Actinoplanes sp. SE50/110]